MSPSASPAKVTASPSILSQINEAKSQITPMQRLLLTTVGMLIVTLGIGILFIHLPWQEKRLQLASQYNEEKERSELLLNIQRQKADLQSIESEFLLEGGITSLAGQISQLATQSGLQIDSVTPQQELVVTPYTRYQIEIIATGDLFSVLQLLKTVEDHRPLFWVEQLEMGGTPTETRPLFPVSIEKPADSSDGRQKVRLLVGAVSRQKAP